MARKPTLFLSYRRESNADLARFIYEHLSQKGVDVYFDVESINGGRFDSAIEREIITRDAFLVILAPDTFKSVWVEKEVRKALDHQKNIIPLITKGFSFGENLPASISDLAHYGGIDYDFKAHEKAFERIEKALNLPKSGRLTIGIILAVVAVVIILAFLISQYTIVNNPIETATRTVLGDPTSIGVVPSATIQPATSATLLPPTNTVESTNTNTVSPNPTDPPTATPTPTTTPTPTLTPSPTPTASFTPTFSPTPQPTVPVPDVATSPVDPCNGRVNTASGASGTFYRQRPPNGSASVANNTEVRVVSNAWVASEQRFYYEIRFSNESGFIRIDQVLLSSECPYKKP
jgi:hypothetical protein